MAFSAPAQVMQYAGINAPTLVSASTADGIHKAFMQLPIQTTGSYTPLSVLNLSMKLNIKKMAKELANAKVYYTRNKDSFSTATLFGVMQNRNGLLSIDGQQELQSGTNYFWIPLDFMEQLSVSPMLVLQFVSCTTGLQDYQTNWADDFNTDGPPDSANWRFEKGFVRNEEDQWYQTENAFCKNGILTIEARRDSLPNPRYEEGSHDWRKNRKLIRYTSSSINTHGKQAWTYGRWEMRARLDTNSGCWPAWWALDNEGGGWPGNGEIDMMEFYRGKILANYAVATQRPNTPKWYSTATPIADFNKHNWADSFHNWRMDWDSAGIAIYLDSKLLNYQPQVALYNRTGNNSYFPFRHPQYMLLNFAIGGQNGGNPSYTSFPRKYDIDYVRVLQKVPGKYSDIKIHY